MDIHTSNIVLEANLGAVVGIADWEHVASFEGDRGSDMICGQWDGWYELFD